MATTKVASKVVSKVAMSILAERKMINGVALCSQHQLTKKQYIENIEWLLNTFKSINTSYNDDGSSEPINITIGF